MIGLVDAWVRRKLRDGLRLADLILVEGVFRFNQRSWFSAKVRLLYCEGKAVAPNAEALDRRVFTQSFTGR